jgi:hypothetical protein
MWGSIVHELGSAVAYPLLHSAVDFLVEVAKSETVGSIVALLLVANLVGGLSHRNGPSLLDNVVHAHRLPLILLTKVGHDRRIVEQLQPHLWQVVLALRCSFTGEYFKERLWVSPMLLHSISRPPLEARQRLLPAAPLPQSHFFAVQGPGPCSCALSILTLHEDVCKSPHFGERVATSAAAVNGDQKVTWSGLAHGRHKVHSHRYALPHTLSPTDSHKR